MLFETFLQDSRRFIIRMDELLSQLKSDPTDNDSDSGILNELFRCAHSLKSEASYLGYEDIGSVAHELEDNIQIIQGLNTEARIQLIAECLESVGVLKQQIDGLSEPADDDSSEEVLFPDGSFERMLLNDAYLRGETLYRLVFRISSTETMKYARAYLALSNLEMKFNVIKCFPEIHKDKNWLTDTITVYLTTEYSESEILSVLNIDNISEISIDKVSGNSVPSPHVFKGEPESPGAEYEAVTGIQTSEEISAYIRELKNRLNEITSLYSADTEDREKRFRSLDTISEGIEKLMDKLRLSSLSVQYEGFGKLVSDMAARLGKKAELEIKAEDVRVERELLEFLTEPLIHLLRNAVVHGIEIPEERTAAGKPETGKVLLDAEWLHDCLTVSISDDGKGINEKGLGMQEILQTIARQGYTSSDSADQHSGRGLGLGIVIDRLKEKGGELEISGNSGSGCTFVMKIPAVRSIERLLVFAYGTGTYSVKTAPDSEPFLLDESLVDVSQSDGSVEYKGVKIYSAEGLLDADESGSLGGKYLVGINYMEREAYLLLDEPLFIKTIEADRIILGERQSASTCRIYIDGKEQEYYYVRPAVILS